MKGKAAMRRTLKYLQSKPLFLKDSVKVMAVHYNNGQAASKGAYDFMFWHVPQLQYCNPTVQIVTFKNMTPSPFLRFYFDNGENMMVELDSMSRHEIMDHLQNHLCKSSDILQLEMMTQVSEVNKADFGLGHDRWCMCEVPGQVPCPGWVPLPKHMRAKYHKFGKEEVEQ